MFWFQLSDGCPSIVLASFGMYRAGWRNWSFAENKIYRAGIVHLKLAWMDADYDSFIAISRARYKTLLHFPISHVIAFHIRFLSCNWLIRYITKRHPRQHLSLSLSRYNFYMSYITTKEELVQTRGTTFGFIGSHWNLCVWINSWL